MKAKTACFSGHRVIPNTALPLLAQKLDNTIAELVDRGVIYFGSGAARGFDQLAALAVLKYKERDSTVKLILVLPCRDQNARWPDADKQRYQQLLLLADKVVCLSDCYYNGCMEKRNLYLVQNSGVCVAYMTHERSGTSQTCRLAREHGLTVINLSDEKRSNFNGLENDFSYRPR